MGARPEASGGVTIGGQEHIGAVSGVNAVAPSIAMHEFLNRVTRDDLLTELRRREAFGRTAEVWEIANVIVFLAGDLSSYMTGEVISVSSQRA